MSANSLAVLNPYTRELIVECNLHTETDVENAIQSAYNSYLNLNDVLPPYQRLFILEKAAKLLNERKDSFIQTAILEGGKPYVDTKVEIERAIEGIKIAAAYLRTMQAEQVPMGLTPSSSNRITFSFSEPIGVVFAISAFNHPLNLIVHQVIPAVAVGAPVIIKPALETPLSCISFMQLLYDAGLPKSYAQVLLVNNELAEKIVSDKRIAYLNFIGSAKIGWYLRSKLANGANAVLEHGGSAPLIVSNATLSGGLFKNVAKACFYHAGQVCVSTQRIFIQQADFLDQFREETWKQKVGDPLDPETMVGPLIRPQEVDRMEKIVSMAISAGANVICGGKRISETCFEPTVIFNPNPEINLYKDEIFGPIAIVSQIESLHQAVKLANDVPFAFQAAIVTDRINDALYASRNLKATSIMVNDMTVFRTDWMPFGGFQESGLGLGGIPYTMKAYSRNKMICIKSSEIV